MAELHRLLFEIQSGDSEWLFFAMGALLLVILHWCDTEKSAIKAVASGIFAVVGAVGAFYFVVDFLS